MINYLLSILCWLGLASTADLDALTIDQVNTLVQDNKTEIYHYDQSNARILSWDNDEEIY